MKVVNRVYLGLIILFGLTIIFGCTNMGVDQSQTPTSTPAQAVIDDNNTALTPEVLPTQSLLPTPFLPTAFPEPDQVSQLDEVSQYDRPQYFIDARLDFEARVVDIQQVVIYTNQTGEPLNEILLLVDANWKEDVFLLDTLTWADGSPVETWFLEGGFLTIRFSEALSPLQTTAVNLHYLLKLPAERAKLGYSPNQLNLGDWYPMIAVYRSGSRWLAYPQNPVGETMVYESGDYQVRLKVDNAPEGLIIAASLPAEIENDAYLYSGETLRNFALSMSSSYDVLRDKVGEVEVISYFYPEYRSAGAAALKSAVQAIQVYSDLFGLYPHRTYSVVSGNFPDGLEFDGLAFTGLEYYAWYDGTEKNYLTLITIHEAAHQWWFAQVGNDQALEPWLDEALSIYSEYLFIEEVNPAFSDWWWEFRIDPFRPFEGSVNESVYAHRNYRPYVNAVYLRGADMLHAVRERCFSGGLARLPGRFSHTTGDRTVVN
jgi:hypothetical protein